MKQKRMWSNIFLYLMVFSLMVFSVHAYASPEIVNLGTAGNYVILAKTGISTTGTTSITGNIGVSPNFASSITGFGLSLDPSGQFATSVPVSLVSGRIYAADYAPPTPTIMTVAILDMQTAYTDAAGRAPDVTGLGAGDISGMTLEPGVYKWTTGLLINTGTPLDNFGVTLNCLGNANAVFIFQIAQDLTVGNGAKVTLINGCEAKNIFWQVAGKTTLGTTSIFNGIILDQTLIEIKNGATLNGRALAQSAVTLIANTVSSPVTPVSPVLPGIILLPTSLNLIIGSTLQLNGQLLDASGLPMAGTITYTSSNPSIVTVDPLSGLVTGVGVGSATITATSGRYSVTRTITVDPVGHKTVPVMDYKLLILLAVCTVILGLYGFKKYRR